MADYKHNFKNSFKDLTCDMCNSHEDAQPESFRCKKIFKDEDNNAKYEDIFEEEVPINVIKALDRIRKAKLMK